MNFSFQRHMRTAGSVTALVGLVFNNWYVVGFGWLLVFVGYMVAVAKIEAYIESQSDPEDK